MRVTTCPRKPNMGKEIPKTQTLFAHLDHFPLALQREGTKRDALSISNS